MPFGKLFKLLKGASVKLGIKEIKKIIEKEIKKAAKRALKQENRKQRKAEKAERKSKIDKEIQKNAENSTNESVETQPTTSKEQKSTLKPWNGKYKKKRRGVSGKEGAKDPPSWAKEHRPREGESGKEFAKRIMDEKYGPNNYPERTKSEFNQIKKWADRSFE
jgi:hypothetical protein